MYYISKFYENVKMWTWKSYLSKFYPIFCDVLISDPDETGEAKT